MLLVIWGGFTFHSISFLFQESSKAALFLFKVPTVQDLTSAPSAAVGKALILDPRWKIFPKYWVFRSAVITVQGQSKLTLRSLVTSKGMKCGFYSLLTASMLEVLSGWIN